jgi:8-oxo-dGTP diphosphatase
MKPGVDFVGLGVGGLILRDDRVLMLLRSERCRNSRHMWTIPGGMVEPQERLEEAVRREVREETGLEVSSAKFLALSDRSFDGQHWVSVLYLCEAAGTPQNKEPDMHEKLEWHDIGRLPANITLPSRDAIESYKTIG